MDVQCGICATDLAVATAVSSGQDGQPLTRHAVCWACGASVARRVDDGTIVTNPAHPEARFSVQRVATPTHVADLRARFETFEGALEACDVHYPLHPTGERQELTDTDTGERWWRADGGETWRPDRRGSSPIDQPEIGLRHLA